jgi:hypothetical protein
MLEILFVLSAMATPSPELLTIRTAAQALSFGDPVQLENLDHVTSADSVRSDLSVKIELGYRLDAGPFKSCTAFAWYDFDGHSVVCDECRQLPPGSEPCACPSAACEQTDGTTRLFSLLPTPH